MANFIQITMGTQCLCTMGLTPSNLIVIPSPSRVMVCGKPAVNMMDHIVMVNVFPFGMCKSPSNPAVISMTAAALGVFTPAPCIPMTSTPIMNTNPKLAIEKFGAAHMSSKIMCMWGGSISPMSPPQVTVVV